MWKEKREEKEKREVIAKAFSEFQMSKTIAMET